MAANSSKAAGGGSFTLTPHKVSVCVVVGIYAPPSQSSVPFPFSSVSQHNRLALFLLSITKSFEDVLEPALDELISQLAAVDALLSDWLAQHLTTQLHSLASPDDLFNFFSRLRSMLASSELGNFEEDQICLDPTSHLGMFLRRCILAYNVLSFEGMCHLLTSIRIYCKANDFAYEMPDDDDFDDEMETMESDDDVDLDNYSFQKNMHTFEDKSCIRERSTFHIQTPSPLSRIVQDVQLFGDSKRNHHNDIPQSNEFSGPLNGSQNGDDHQSQLFIRSNWQVQGYLKDQADLIEHHGSSLPSNPFEAIRTQLQKLAPELHFVHYLNYLSSLHHEDYLAALENLHCYFDYSAGMDGIDAVSSSSPSYYPIGRYETALLCLGILHSHFGHSKQALEALTEAVQISQQNSDDTCLAYTLAAMCNLLSEVSISNATNLMGSTYSPGSCTSLGTSLSAQQELLVLLKRSLKRAESLKLTRLVAFNRLALAKFDLKHVRRPLISFGPKAPIKHRTNPVSVCKELRLSSYLLSEFGSDGASQTLDGSFSTAWLKNLQRASTSTLMLHENVSGNDYDSFCFGAQPNPVPAAVLQLAGSSYLLRATSWEFYGSASLVRLNTLVYATCFADAGSSSDLSLAYVKLIQHLATFKGYKEAFSALKLAEEKFVSVSRSPIQLLKLQLLHDCALHRGHLKVAKRLCGELGLLASSASGVDMELKIESSLRHARTLLAAKQYSQAADVAHSLFSTCYKYNMQIERATALLLLAEIYMKSGNPVLALPYASASLHFCKSFNLDLLEASVTLMLSELWLSFGSKHAKRALGLIYQKLAMILGHGGLELQARANISVAKCYLLDSTFSVSEDPDMVLEPLKQAADSLQVLEYHELAAEAFYLMAMVFDKLGRLEEREEAAECFKKHISALQKPEDIVDPFNYGAEEDDSMLECRTTNTMSR